MKFKLKWRKSGDAFISQEIRESYLKIYPNGTGGYVIERKRSSFIQGLLERREGKDLEDLLQWGKERMELDSKIIQSTKQGVQEIGRAIDAREDMSVADKAIKD